MNREKHKLPRRILALLLTLAMFVTMFPTAMFATNGNAESSVPTLDVSKSKTAENLVQQEDGSWQSDVTLSLPAADYSQQIDVVFVIDDTSAGSGIFEASANALLDELAEKKNLDINVGLVTFDAVARDWLAVTSNNAYSGLVSIKDSGALNALKKAIGAELSYNNPEGYTQKIGGTNTEWPIAMATDMLNNSGRQDAEKQMLIFSDMYGYVYRGTMNVGGTEYQDVPMGIIHSGSDLAQLGISAPKYDSWNELCKNNNEKNDTRYDSFFRDSSWDAYWKIYQGLGDSIPERVEVNTPEWGVRYFTPFEKSTCLTYENIFAARNQGVQITIINNDFSTDYDAIQKIKNEMLDDLVENNHVSLIRETVEDPEVGFTSDQMNTIFDDLTDELIQVVDAGSYVVDVIGDDFDFVKDSAPTLTVEGGAVQVTFCESDVLEESGATAAWYYGDNAEDPRFELYYYADGTQNPYDEEHLGECFIWKTNEAITKDATVQLTYTVQLSNPKTDPGTYGQFDGNGDSIVDGTEEMVKLESALYTNESATIYPMETGSTEVGTPEDFPKPSVSYTITEEEPITITPADITIYTGGAGYGGVTDANGNIIQSTETTGLPEPGYHITLTESAVDWLREQLNLGEDAGLTAQDLSEYLSFDYNNGGVTRHWDMAYVGVYDQDAAGQPTQYVYSLLPSETGDSSEDLVPVRLLYWEDSNGDKVLSQDESPINTDDILMAQDIVSKNYAMTINPGELDQDEIKATLAVDGEQKTFDVNIGTGTLTVKSTTNDETTTMIASNENDVNSSTIQAVGNNVTYYVNDSEVEINNDSNRVQLLVDEISNNDGFNTTMGNDAIDRVADQFAGSADLSYDTAYMDLVDTENGNAVVTMGDDDWLDLYWPAPNNAAADSKYYIVHYTDMNRLEITDDVAQAAAKEIEGKRVTIGENDYIKFNVTSFSPFVLVWEEKEPYVPPYNPGTGDNDDDEPPALNTEDHYLYIEGYPEDYRTGEYSDNEDLWPVKPQGNITRAEVATVFYRLLKDEVRDEVETDVNSFTDVNADDWFNITVSSLANMGIIAGYEDGSFRPNAPITRAEFAAIAARFFENNDVEYNEGLFEDITGDEWYADIVAAAVAHDLISGYPDGTMRPMANITRAEACAIVNRTIDRRPHDEHLCPVEEMRTWPDNQPGAWYYADMQEATNGHYYEWIDIDGNEFEEWTEVDKDYDWTKR